MNLQIQHMLNIPHHYLIVALFHVKLTIKRWNLWHLVVFRCGFSQLQSPLQLFLYSLANGTQENERLPEKIDFIEPFRGSLPLLMDAMSVLKILSYAHALDLRVLHSDALLPQ